ncbi:MAG: tRNA (adenosine(37)-N6)-threonylcarbamoyltransferase complex dimerization subunit type 1 TsaB [Bacteroidota bacterium]|nr:tRNA (adenosine(37)-N6)-threonylcarbamoyltransferase complex dimerization subunit type 1 TsaB [Bacteroidota bacterium]MDP4196995.1 tRNA (adenosine(37)-N6)-threonylcarbamoyltransferase complex dimerization subunit type 1 TsaB [Bacteroidota bacterium]
MSFADKKPILAIETSGELCSAAVYFDQYKFAEVNLRLKHVHSEKIIDIIDEVLKQVQLQFSDLSSIAISSGPGSFTGLRIGMSAVKGLALGSGLPLIAVPTFEALAYQICTYLPVGTEFFIANKVNLEEVYNAKFRKILDGYEFIDKLSVTWNEEFENRLNDKSLLFGNFIPGNTAVSTCSVAWPSASSVARWAYKFGKDSLTYDYDFLEPFYLKNFVIKEHK